MRKSTNNKRKNERIENSQRRHEEDQFKFESNSKFNSNSTQIRFKFNSKSIRFSKTKTVTKMIEAKNVRESNLFLIQNQIQIKFNSFSREGREGRQHT